jgi:hypothetical protein
MGLSEQSMMAIIVTLIEDKAHSIIRDMKADEGDKYVLGRTDEELLLQEKGYVISTLREDLDLDPDEVQELMKFMEVEVLE